MPSEVTPVPPFAIGNVPVTFDAKLTNVVEVDPVPPLAIGKAVPDNVTAKVPLLVIGDPDTDKNDGTVMATDVTVPEVVLIVAQVPSPLK